MTVSKNIYQLKVTLQDSTDAHKSFGRRINHRQKHRSI